MKRQVTAIFTIVLGYVLLATPLIVSADHDYDGESHEDGNEWLEEIGEAMGWGTVGLAVGAGMLYPVRRFSKRVNKSFPNSKKEMAKFSRSFGKIHMPIGITAVLLSILHGVLMYLDEEALEANEWLGIITSGFFILAAFIGVGLWKNKRLRFLRKTHIGLLIVATIIAIIHIAVS